MERAGHERRVGDQPVVGAEQAAHRLLQDQRHAPGREQRLERAGVEIADDQPLDRDADDRGDDERRAGWRRRATSSAARAAERAGRRRCIGAEHHHLAMRHVDDAHDAEGDGEADRGEQQNRGRREAVPEVLRRAPEHAAGSGSTDSADVGGGLDLRIGRLLVELVDQALRVLVAAGLQRLDRRKPIRRRSPGRSSPTIAATASFSASATRGSLSLASCALQRRQRLGVARPEHVSGRGEPLLRIGIGERQRAHRALDGDAQRVVDPHLLEGGGVGDRCRRSWR